MGRLFTSIRLVPALYSRFSAASPIPGPVSLSEHALVANQQEGMLLALGGCLTSGDRRHRHSRMFDQVSPRQPGTRPHGPDKAAQRSAGRTMCHSRLGCCACAATNTHYRYFCAIKGRQAVLVHQVRLARTVITAAAARLEVWWACSVVLASVVSLQPRSAACSCMLWFVSRAPLTALLCSACCRLLSLPFLGCHV